MSSRHPLLDPPVAAAIEGAASAHRGRRWTSDPVPDDVLDGYRDLMALDAGFESRIELWRMFAYLAVIAVDGDSPLGRQFVRRLDDAARRYA